MEKTQPRWSAQTKLVISLLMLALGIFLIYRFRAAIPSLIIAIILAYILYPFVNWFQERLRIHRVLAIIITYIVVILPIVIILFMLIPPLYAQSKDLNLNIHHLISQAKTLLGNKYVVFGQTINLEDVFNQLTKTLKGLTEPFFGQTVEIAFEIVSSLVWVMFILIISFYLVKDGGSLNRWLEDIIPQDYKQDYIQLRLEINQIWSAFFRGQLVLMLVVSAIITITSLIIGLPYALAMGVLAGILELLPSIGNAIWLVIASILALFAGSTWLPIPNWIFMLLVIILHALFSQFDMSYLIPRVIGRRVQLPPVIIIIGTVIGALLAGVLGILLAAPTISSARVLSRYIFANLFDQEPFPEVSSTNIPSPDSC